MPRGHVAGAGTHDQASQRGVAHGGVDGLAALHSGHGRAVTEVSNDAVELCRVQCRACSAATWGDVLVVGAVEAVAADAVKLSARS